MNAIILAAAAGYGALIGSFLNVCIFRLPRRCLRLWRPKLSFCPACARTIPWHENLPMISLLALRGRCKGCRAKIPARYFLVELATTVCFFGVAYRNLAVDERHWGLAAAEVIAFATLLVWVLIAFDTGRFWILPTRSRATWAR